MCVYVGAEVCPVYSESRSARVCLLIPQRVGQRCTTTAVYRQQRHRHTAPVQGLIYTRCSSSGGDDDDDDDDDDGGGGGDGGCGKQVRGM